MSPITFCLFIELINKPFCPHFGRKQKNKTSMKFAIIGILLFSAGWISTPKALAQNVILNNHFITSTVSGKPASIKATPLRIQAESQSTPTTVTLPYIRLAFSTHEEINGKIAIYDEQNRLSLLFVRHFEKGENQHVLDVSSLKEGKYTAQIKTHKILGTLALKISKNSL